MRVEVDTSEFPLVLVTYPEHGTIEELQVFIDEMELVYQRGGFAVLADLRAMDTSLVSADLRKFTSQQLDQLKKKYPGAIICEAMVADSPLLRGILTAYRWFITNKSYPSRVFKNKTDARAFCVKHLSRAGV